MAAFGTLLRRFNERTSFVDDSAALKVLREKDEPPLNKAWHAWAFGQRALSRKQPESSLIWLREVGDAVSDDLTLRAEVLSAEAECWRWLDEPRSAIGPAQDAWDNWLEIARAPDPDVIGPSASALLDVLSAPDPTPELSRDELFYAWLQDRFALQFEAASRRLLGLYADFNDADGAKRVSSEFLDLYEPRLKAMAGGLSDVVVAKHLISLGDVFDRCGDSEQALKAFRDGLDKLDAVPELSDVDEIVWMRAQLQFNAANQLAQLDDHVEALELFEASAELLERFGQQESILRARYAIVFTKYLLERRQGLENELMDLAKGYEDVLRETKTGSGQMAAWQMVNKVYRLWTKLSAETLDTRDALQTRLFFHQLLALKEWEAKLTEVWHKFGDHPDAAHHSEISVMLDRFDQHSDVSLLVIEQAHEALILASLSAGSGDWNTRVAVQVIEGEATQAVTSLIFAQREAVHDLVEGSIERDAPPGEQFLEACGRAWSSLDTDIRQSIESAETLLVTIDNHTELDQLPVELFHDGSDYLGLRKKVVRVPSLTELNVLLCENRTNASATGSALIVRADDELPVADVEVQVVDARLQELEFDVNTARGPDADDLIGILRSGVDVWHYVGHGLADEVGEELPLGQGKWLSARDMDNVGPAPAPVTMLSGCLTGRGRQLRTGHLQGFVSALLGRGAPGVIAAKYLVGEEFVAEFADLVYEFWNDNSLGDAVREARRVLAEDNYHPAVWCSYVIFGSPDVVARAPHENSVTTWPAAVCRYLATGSQRHLAEAQKRLAADDRLSPESRRDVAADLNALAEERDDYFDASSMSQGRGLDAYSEAMFASNLIMAFGVMRHADVDEASITGILKHVFTVQRILGDSYVYVAAAIELRRRTMLALRSNGKSILRTARRRLRWLSADHQDLADAASDI